MEPARWYESEPDGRLRCTLCPRECLLRDGQAGFCTVREHRAGRMVLAAHGRSTGFAVDPIEKKPLHHFFPGTRVLSFGTVGCNLGCRFCQNWGISRAGLAELAPRVHTAAEVVDLAVAEGCPSIAFTYNDPVIWAEWAIEVAKEAHARGLSTVFVTAGYVKPRAREEIFAHMDAANVDLKAMSESFYRKVTLSHLAPVLDTLAWLARSRVWTEVTNLVIPGQNDAPDELRALAAWVARHMGPDTPLHFSAFRPGFRMADVPPTPLATLRRAREVARAEGLRHVYTGNVRDPEGEATACPRCGSAVIVRDGYRVTAPGLEGDRCRACGERIAGRFRVARAAVPVQ